jgi:serine protease
MKRWGWIGLVLAAGLVACPAPTTTGKDISGAVSLPARGQSVFAVGGSPSFGAGEREAVPGEVIVRFRNAVRTQSLTTLSVGGVNLQTVRSLALEGTRLYRASTGADVESLATQLRSRSDVLWAQPNYIDRAFATPNDTNYSFQWHYPAINLPQAWDSEKGLTNAVTVAVIDTGVLKAHPEFQGKLVGGYDFITSPQNSGDGDGRDNNADDPGDNPTGQSSYHGSHVAGTVAALTDNNDGVAGVSWGAKILPVRVLGLQGGSQADIADAMVWSAGVNVTGVPANPNPAQVINMSLGGQRPCSDTPIYQEAIDAVNAKGAIIVVAAGNSNIDATGFAPASCSGVITVGATEFQNHRARYSNFGPRVDVMAPGGDVEADLNEDNFVDGVLSLGKNDQTGEFNFIFENGTSMASPHVAGVVALMKSRDPSLTLARALDVLKRTSKPLTATACTGPGPAQLPQDCGAGLVDAAAAIAALNGGGGPAPTPDFTLSLNPSSVQLKPGSSQNITVNIARSAGFADPLSFTLVGASAGITGTFSAQGNNAAQLSLNVASSVAKGSYALTVRGVGGALTRNANLSLRVETTVSTAPSVQGTVVLACYYLGNDCDTVRSRIAQVGTGTTQAAYSLKGLDDGEYLMIAWKDLNGDTEVNNGDYIGVYTQNANLALVRPPASNVNMPLETIDGLERLSLTPRRVTQLMRSVR